MKKALLSRIPEGSAFTLCTCCHSVYTAKGIEVEGEDGLWRRLCSECADRLIRAKRVFPPGERAERKSSFLSRLLHIH